MKFSVGYQLISDDELIDKIIEYKNSISEVYFSWGDFPNGRNSQIKRADMTPWEAQSKQMQDIERLSKAGIKLNLLFNATCYGRDAQSKAFFQKIGDTVDFIITNYGLASVTTASPIIARFIKTNFDGIDVRASVNMGIGSQLGMEYVMDVFDSFYIKRELNRDFAKIKELKSFCEKNGKMLYALANSGCLNNCSAHTFHDNLVSHESEISVMDNGYAFSGVCQKFLQKKSNLSRIFECTNFIRPEDVYLYEGIFPAMKLATRVNSNPVRVIDAYIKRAGYVGSVFDLCEPNHTNALYPNMIENSLIQTKIENEKLNYINIEGAIINVNQ
jgi:hypothetical protein